MVRSARIRAALVIPACSELGIADEGSYQDHEHKLSAEKRGAIGEHRFEFLIAPGRRDDPCEVARCAPPWLQNENLARLRISVPLMQRVKSAARRNCYIPGLTKIPR
jgi:hypothetical protein